MSSAQSFPLSRSPLLVQECIVRQMDMQEQFKLACSSMRAQRLVRFVNPRGKLLELILTNTFHLRIVSFNSAGEREILPFIIQPVESDSNICLGLAIQTVDMKQTLEHCIEIAINAFNCKKASLTLAEKPSETFKSVISFVTLIKKCGLEISEFCIYGETATYKQCRYIIEEFRNAEKISMNFSNTDFRPIFRKNEHVRPFSFKKCQFEEVMGLDSSFVTSLFLNCQHLELKSLEIMPTFKPLTEFVKAWIKGSALEFVKFATLLLPVSLELSSVVQDIASMPVRLAYIENKLRVFEDGRAFKITQDSGKEAVICCTSISFFLTTHFDNEHSDLWPHDQL